ncbi:MAG: response regulator transcription factor [Verrucomicrobiaceae bacterium]|nr:response regulator transcription factor [Verrucomicrobiaceae bacterium]
MPKKTRVLIVDDHFATRLGLSVPINAEKDMTVIAEAGTGGKAVALYREHRPDVVLMDYDLPDQNGVQTLSIIRNEFPDARILMLTILEGEEDIWRAVSAGARGYLTKSSECEQVLAAIRAIAAGETYFPPAIIAKIRAREKRKPLTERELEILRLLVRGHSTKEIVDMMKLSMGTIRLHISIILEKLDAFDRTNAVAIAIERGIVRVGE